MTFLSQLTDAEREFIDHAIFEVEGLIGAKKSVENILIYASPAFKPDFIEAFASFVVRSRLADEENRVKTELAALYQRLGKTPEEIAKYMDLPPAVAVTVPTTIHDLIYNSNGPVTGPPVDIVIVDDVPPFAGHAPQNLRDAEVDEMYADPDQPK